MFYTKDYLMIKERRKMEEKRALELYREYLIVEERKKRRKATKEKFERELYNRTGKMFIALGKYFYLKGRAKKIEYG